MTTARFFRSGRSIGLLFAIGAAAMSAGCKSGADGIGLSKEQQGDDAFADVPSPPADGPKIIALREGTPILDRPRPDAQTIGELRLGAAIPRSAEPYSRKGCDEGWYAVRPRGFVCAGTTATLAASAAEVLPTGPDLSRPLPSRYGRAKYESVATYSRLPTLAEQNAAEPDLSKHLPRSQGAGDPLPAAANDVPLDARGVPTGPPVILPGGDGVDESSRRTTASFFTFASGERIPPLVPLSILRGEAPSPAPLRRGSGVAVTGVFSADGGAAMRHFGLLTDGRAVPIDRLKPALGSTWHGIDLEKAGLPVGFVHKRGVNTYALSRGKAEAQDDELERRTAVPLTGRFRTVSGVRYEQAREGFWLRSQDLVMVVRRSKFPEFAKGSQKWLDVSLANQTLTAYEGSKPVFATLISSGRDQLKDP
ncbi:MAG: L,D-transpeptidase, partial [Polyangiaceae bacterium]|nr:L,D-transpeptidase [Polyangiaceae bacterium]